MPHFKPVHRGLKLLPVDFDRQVQPGFEFALCHPVDTTLDLSAFHARYANDEVGASALRSGGDIRTPFRRDRSLIISQKYRLQKGV